MTAFLAISGVLAALALVHLLRPLWRGAAGTRISRDAANVSVYRDQLRELDADLASGAIAREHYERARMEIEMRLLEDVGAEPAPQPQPRRSKLAAVALALLLPVLASALYLAVGTPQAMFAEAPQADQAVSREQIQAMVSRLAERLKSEPDNPQGWAMLGRSYTVLERFPEAAAAYEEAVKRAPRDAQLLTDYADALAMGQGRSLRGTPEKLIARALEIDPDNIKALALAGSAAFDRKDYATAIRRWEHIIAVSPPDSPFLETVRTGVADAKAEAAKTRR